MSFLKANEKLVEKFGLSCTYTSFTEGTYNTSTRTKTNTSANTTIDAVKSLPNKRDMDSPDMIGMEVASFFILPTLVPKTEDKITFSSQVFTIKKIQEQRGIGGELAGYKLLAIKG